MNNLQNLYLLARREKNKDTFESNSLYQINEKAREYYDKILEMDPISWEALFYSCYYQVASQMKKDFNEYYISRRLNDSSDGGRGGMGHVGSNVGAYCITLKDNNKDVVELISRIPDEQMKKSAILEVRKRLEYMGFTLFWHMISHYAYKKARRNNVRTMLNEFEDHIRTYCGAEYEGAHYILEETSSSSSSSQGCYIATAVYGSYDCPQVWVLRRYRDYHLSEHWYGRLFVKSYYAISPTFVKLFGSTKWFNNFWKGKLDRMAKKLIANGYQDTPYIDKNW